MAWKIPLADVDLGPAERAAVQRVLDSGWLTMGEETQQFEQEFALYVGVPHALAVTNATAALHMACAALDIGPGDEVIVPALTFVATANAVRYTGATPVFADITSAENLNISVESIAERVTPRTRAIMIMHYGGYPVDMPAVHAIAQRHNLRVIEDAAHAPGSELDGRKAGDWSDIACFSFFSNKNMTTGEGGMVTTRDDQLAARLRVLRSHGMTTMTWDRHKGHAWSYDVVELGYNYRIDELRAAIGREQLKKLTANNARRRELTAAYHRRFAQDLPEVGIPFAHHPGVSSAHLLPILLPEGSNRVAFMEAMKAQGIQTSIHYPPIHLFSAYQRDALASGTQLPLTETYGMREVTLPLYATMADDAVAVVVEAVRAALPEARRASAVSL